MLPVWEGEREAAPYNPYIGLNNTNFNYLSHYHREAEIVYIAFGKTSVAKNNLLHPLSEGDILIIYPYEIHGFVSSESNLVQVMKFSVLPSFPHGGSLNLLSRDAPLYETFHTLFEKIAECYRTKPYGYEYALSAYSGELLFQILGHTTVNRFSDTGQSRVGYELLSRTNAYLEEHYHHPIRLEDVAAYCGYSKYYYAHLFAQCTSTNFGRFLSLFRLNKAKQLLCSDKSITDIALECGFGSPRSLDRCFQTYEGLTPRQFKKNLTLPDDISDIP